MQNEAANNTIAVEIFLNRQRESLERYPDIYHAKKTEQFEGSVFLIVYMMLQRKRIWALMKKKMILLIIHI